MIELNCPHCASQLGIEERYAGQRGRCNKCGGAIVVPSPRNLTRRDFAIGATSAAIVLFVYLRLFSGGDDPAASTESNVTKPQVPDVGLGIGRTHIQQAFPSPEFAMEEGAPVNGQPSMVGQAANSNTLVQMVGPSSNLQSVSLMVVLEHENTQSRRQALAYLRSITELTAPWAIDWVRSNISKAERGEEVSFQSENVTVKLTGIALTDGAIVTMEVGVASR